MLRATWKGSSRDVLPRIVCASQLTRNPTNEGQELLVRAAAGGHASICVALVGMGKRWRTHAYAIERGPGFAQDTVAQRRGTDAS